MKKTQDNNNNNNCKINQRAVVHVKLYLYNQFPVSKCSFSQGFLSREHAFDLQCSNSLTLCINHTCNSILKFGDSLSVQDLSQQPLSVFTFLSSLLALDLSQLEDFFSSQNLSACQGVKYSNEN